MTAGELAHCRCNEGFHKHLLFRVMNLHQFKVLLMPFSFSTHIVLCL